MSEIKERDQDHQQPLTQSEQDEDPPIIDLNPKNLRNKKDNLFFDFFSMYTKNVLHERKTKAM